MVSHKIEVRYKQPNRNNAPQCSVPVFCLTAFPCKFLLHFVCFQYNINIGTQSVQVLFFVVGAFVELFTVMVCLSFLVAMYSKKETGNL